jgi:tetratricopeptide (TPR) repeat protein
MEEGLALIREHGDRVMEAIGLGQLSIETLRYGDPDRARVLREQSLALVRELGHRSNEPWNLWELGEVYRVMGWPDKARRYYDEALPLFQGQGHGFGESYYERGLGDLALATGDFAAAVGHFTAARTLASEYPDQFWSQLYVTIQLARALVGGGQLDEALAQLCPVLPTATAGVLQGLQPGLLTAVAEMALATGRMSAVATLCGLVAAHPMTWNETRPIVARMLGQARAALGETAADAAEARGRTLDAPTLIARLAALPPDLAAWLDVLAE